VTDPLVWLPFDPELLDPPPGGLRYEVVSTTGTEPVPDSVADVELYVTPYSFSTRAGAVMAEMSSLKVVQTQSAGVDHIRPFVPDGVLLCNGRGVHDASTAELAVTLVLASLRGVPGFVRAQDTATWAPATRRALADSRVLVVGYGAIGEALERRLTGFECDVIRVARRERDGVHPISQLPELLPRADVVVLLTPATPETERMVDAKFLASMKDGALLVNVARGVVVDTDALLAELGTRRIRAALDVTDPEPLPAGHPLWSAPNVLINPHRGGASTAFAPRVARLVRAQLERYASGEPLINVVAGPPR
jgi:phosphoglycerate dehydrogenase-like enzyme